MVLFHNQHFPKHYANNSASNLGQENGFGFAYSHTPEQREVVLVFSVGTVPTLGTELSISLPVLSSADCCRLLQPVAGQQWCSLPQSKRWERWRHVQSKEYYRCFLYCLVKVSCTHSGPQISKGTWQIVAYVALLPRKVWIPARHGDCLPHRRPSAAVQGLCSPRVVPNHLVPTPDV